jgi:hypothetical protein
MIPGTAAVGGMLVSADEPGSIRISSFTRPPMFYGGLHDFSVLLWVRREAEAAAGRGRIFSGGSVLAIAVDDETNTLDLDLSGTHENLSLSLPVRVAGGATVPVDAWMLLGCTWHAAEGRLTAWARAEHGIAVSDTAADPTWTGNAPWPIVLGANDADPGFEGQIGLVVLRDHRIDGDDFDAIWADGAPSYFAPALLTSGNMTGFDGVAWMVAHGIATSPRRLVNPNATGAELGDAVGVDNLLVYNANDASNYYSAGLINEVRGSWTMESPHQPGAGWAGFFVREVPDLGFGGPAFVSRVSPRARALADDEPVGLVRVVASANSRAVRVSRSYDHMENWVLGGLLAARRATVAGVIVPGWSRTTTSWLGFDGAARKVGEVHDSSETPHDSVAFGRFGSHGLPNPNFGSYRLAGRAIVIEPDASYVPKARPEPGTMFSRKTDPLVVRVMLLEFPGSGAAITQGEKAASQQTASVSTDGEPTTTALDTTVVSHAVKGGDDLDADARTLTLARHLPEVEVGHGCYVDAGPGAGGISMVVDVTLLQGRTVVTLEHWFPGDPGVGSVVRFGPVRARWIQHAWSGLNKGDPEEYRGINVTAADGPVVLLFSECFNPAADGFVIGAIGTSGRGYELQLRSLFRAGGIPFISALDADVWLQFFAHQGSVVESMSDFGAEILRASPETEVWWCGDPDLDTGVDDSDETDAWQTYILEHAATAGVGAVVAHEHPSVGTGNERAIDGQSADSKHLSGRGCAAYVEAVLDVLRSAAEEDRPPCPGDVDGDGVVDAYDVVMLVAAWGPCPPEEPCPGDTDEDGSVGTNDLLALLMSWGPCPIDERRGGSHRR